jgi:hypothetical protein|nr:MAG TPA: hypothetical protein [Caudoviricetes sp.]
MAIIKITLEDKGQDFLELYVSEEDETVIDAQPFQGSIWKGAMIPISDKSLFKVGNRCPIHHPPHIKFGFLDYKIEKIERIEYKTLTCSKCHKEIKGGFYAAPSGAVCCNCWENKTPQKVKDKALADTLKGLSIIGKTFNK